MTSKKRNLIKVLSGKKPEWVPFSINFNQWFVHLKKFRSLPEELKNCEDYIDAMKVLDCDIFSRNIDGGVKTILPSGFEEINRTPLEIGNFAVHTYQTPFGKLYEKHQYQEKISTGLCTEHLLKDWEKERDAALYYLENKNYDWDENIFEKTNQKVGDDGIVNIALPGSPLKMMQNLFGIENTCFFMIDYENDAKLVCDLYWSKVMRLIKKIVSHPDTISLIIMDNLDSPFYAPNVSCNYWTPYIREASDLVKSKGKFLFSHACGHLALLKDIFVESHLTGLEGISHKPLGDWSPAEALACHHDFVFNGGFSAHEQEMKSEDEVRRFYQQYFATIKDKRRFIFSASCQTSILTSWDRIKLVREICREWGGVPNYVVA